MSTPLKDLERDLARALEKNDLDAAASVRRTLVQAHGETEAGAEASYKLGLDALFRQRNMDAAAECFRTATKVKSAWSLMARSALAMVLLRQGKAQQAVFELRRVAGTTPPTLISASAWGLLVLALKESKQLKEVEKARGEHMKALARLADTAAGEDRALASFMLAMEHKYNGEREPAKKYMLRALEGTALPAEERRQAQAALKEL